MEISGWVGGCLFLLCLKIVFTGIAFNKILAKLRVRKWLVTAVSPLVTSYHFIAELTDTRWQVFDQYALKGRVKNPKTLWSVSP